MKQPNAYPLRIDNDVMDKLRIMADNEGRSLNKQIEYILKLYLQKYLASHPEND